jgi:hypothetical protein
MPIYEYAAQSAGPTILIFILMALAIYFLPSIIALIKRNRRTKVILFNLFLGWTFVMWIISLVWACKRAEEKLLLEDNISSADEIKKYKDLLDAGAITKEEFEAKKEQLLNLL